MPVRGAAWGIYELFPTKDATGVFIGVTSDRHWERFCEAFRLDDLLAEQSLRSNSGRLANKKRISERVSAVVASMTSEAVCKLCDLADIPFSPVARPGDLFDDPHLNAGSTLMKTMLANGCYAKLPGLPLELGNNQIILRRQPPKLGEHNIEIMDNLNNQGATRTA